MSFIITFAKLTMCEKNPDLLGVFNKLFKPKVSNTFRIN